MIDHICDGEKDPPNPPITWSELTAVTVAADNCPILKEDRQTPEDTSHTRTVCEKYIIQSTLKQRHSKTEKSAVLHLDIVVYSQFQSYPSYLYQRVTYAYSTNLQDPLFKNTAI